MEASPAPIERRFDLDSSLSMVWALITRAKNELLRVPGAAIPGVLAPTIFFVGLTSVFGSLTLLPGFTTDTYQSFLIPVSLMQGAGFTGAATGVNLARDIEQGWFDRLLASPAPRPVLLAGFVLSASFRALIPATVLLGIGFAMGVGWPGLPGLLLAIFLVMAMGAAAACWGSMLALKFKSQSAAPLMQSGMFVLILFTTAYAPEALLQPWLADIAQINPVTHVIEAARQGFTTGGITWSETWPGLLAMAGLLILFAALALRGMRRVSLLDVPFRAVADRLDTKIDGLVLIEAQAHGDERGFLVESFSERGWAKLGVEEGFVQHNHSRSSRDILRGIHFQTSPGQAKLVRCVRGAIWDVAVDLRRDSPTYGQWEGYELSDENQRQLFVPVGFGHGFCVLSDLADVTYLLSSYYDPETEAGIKWDDPDVGVEWPVSDPQVSERDDTAPVLAEIAGDLPF